VCLHKSWEKMRARSVNKTLLLRFDALGFAVKEELVDSAHVRWGGDDEESEEEDGDEGRSGMAYRMSHVSAATFPFRWQWWQ
jgi:hypothetical protein